MNEERGKLARWEGQRGTFSAVFVRCGERRRELGRGLCPLLLGRTVLLQRVCDEAGEIVADHVWLDRSKQWEALDPRAGDTVQFRARVKAYVKGYDGFSEEPLKRDWKLVDLRRVVVIRGGERAGDPGPDAGGLDGGGHERGD